MKQESSQTELEKILEVARGGDLLAFEQLLTLFEKQIFRYVVQMVGNGDDAEDLTQEIFIKLYKNLPKYEAGRGFKTWLFTIATNTVYDYLRHKRSIGAKEMTIIDDPESNFETKDEKNTYISIEAGVDVNAALAKIKPAYRNVLLLFYKEELSCEEISETLQVPENTVKTQLRRAREALKMAIENK